MLSLSDNPFRQTNSGHDLLDIQLTVDIVEGHTTVVIGRTGDNSMLIA